MDSRFIKPSTRQHLLRIKRRLCCWNQAVLRDVTLRVIASRLEKADGKSIRARALLEKARLVKPKSDALWTGAVWVEERSGTPAQGKALLARALQECPTSGIVWSMAIWSEARPQRKARSVDALRNVRLTHS